MPETRPGRGVHIVANKEITHNIPHFQGGLVGLPIKQDNPLGFDSLASRTKIASGVKYFLIIKGEIVIDQLEGSTVGALVYIKEPDDSLSLVATGRVVLGRITNIQETFGLPKGKMRVSLDQKV